MVSALMKDVNSDSSCLWRKFGPSRVRRGGIGPGSINDEQFELLVELSPVYSHKAIKSMRDHLVLGHTRKCVCERYNISNGYMSTCLSKLSYTHNLVSCLVKFYKK
ncbi:TPA: PapB/FocB family fimbrial expression transcriptional regulator [Escherichia coli]